MWCCRHVAFRMCLCYEKRDRSGLKKNDRLQDIILIVSPKVRLEQIVTRPSASCGLSGIALMSLSYDNRHQKRRNAIFGGRITGCGWIIFSSRNYREALRINVEYVF